MSKAGDDSAIEDLDESDDARANAEATFDAARLLEEEDEEATTGVSQQARQDWLQHVAQELARRDEEAREAEEQLNDEAEQAVRQAVEALVNSLEKLVLLPAYESTAFLELVDMAAHPAATDRLYAAFEAKADAFEVSVAAKLRRAANATAVDLPTATSVSPGEHPRATAVE
eukprot:558865-Prymnesium_polylepis.1